MDCPRTALGYVRRLSGAATARDPGTQEAKVAAWCERHDMRLVGCVHETDGHVARGLRPGLESALSELAQGRAQTLAVARLEVLGGPLERLADVLGWLRDAQLSLLALDVALDSATAAGRRTVDTLLDVAGWDPARPGPPPGRPGLASLDPALATRIAALRASGLSLRAIADRLNAEGVPTPRGGALWRPSSVQAAAGYRRPKPPPPLPPPPPHFPGRHTPAPPRPTRQPHRKPGRPR